MPILDERYQRLLQHFVAAGVAVCRGLPFNGRLAPEAEVVVIHAAVGALKDIKRRADFEVYLKKFLQSLNLILPNPAGQICGSAPRGASGYLLRMVKERHKDDSLDIVDAGEKVKALITSTSSTSASTPKSRRSSCCPTSSFHQRVHKHSQGNDEAKASEMELTPFANIALFTLMRTPPFTPC
ncbi:MAG: hypothetical protein R3F37_12760 [Candidatus Competibacteraceae bacterium]